MKNTRRTQKVAAAFLVLIAMLSVACGSDKRAADVPDTVPASEVPQGGELTIGAEQEPDCLDFIDLCSGSSWGYWMVAVNTLPRAYSVERVYDGDTPTDEWEWKPTGLLDGEAELDSDPQKITYTINKDAVWDDGTPITGKDFVYTWDQIANGENVYDRTGWQDIDTVTVDKDDDKVVVVTMKKNFAGWKALFGGNYGVLPAHILEGKDRNALTKDGYTFSGGPFKLQSWTKEESIVLVPNDKYWGDKAHLDKVTFKIQPDTNAQFTAFKSGEVSAIYPQPQTDVVDALNSGDLGDVNQIVNEVTGNIEALWLNNNAEPFNSKKVRQALGYSIDRDSVVNALFGDIGVEKAVNSFVAPVLPEFQNTSSFEKYTTNKSKVESLLKEDGWKKNSSGVYAKNGKELGFELISTEGNQRRKLMMENIQKQLNDLGWKVTVKGVPAGDLFGDLGPTGNYQAAIYAQVLTVLDPNNCTLFCSSNIPTESNEFSGNNWTHTRIDAADKLLAQVDGELNESKRQEASRDAEKLLAEDATSFPIDPLPNIFLWKSNVVGPIDENPIQGPFWGLANWGVKK